METNNRITIGMVIGQMKRSAKIFNIICTLCFFGGIFSLALALLCEIVRNRVDSLRFIFLSLAFFFCSTFSLLIFVLAVAYKGYILKNEP